MILSIRYKHELFKSMRATRHHFKIWPISGTEHYKVHYPPDSFTSIETKNEKAEKSTKEESLPSSSTVGNEHKNYLGYL